MEASVTLLIPTLLVMRQGRGSEATEAVSKKPHHTEVRTGRHYLISLCVTFVVFTDCESCTRPISNSGSMEAGECGRTHGTCFITCRLEVVAVAGLLCFSWCVFGGAFFSAFSMSLHFQSRTPREVRVDSAKGIRRPANLPTDNSRPPIPTRCTVYCAPT